MGEAIGAQPPAWLRLAAVLALLWNLYGCYEYLVSVEMLPGESMADEGLPAWVVGAFAVSVFAGALGSLGLLLLRRWSKLLLLLSLVALLAQDLWAYVLREGGGDKGAALPLIINLVAILLVWLAYMADRNGWLR